MRLHHQKPRGAVKPKFEVTREVKLKADAPDGSRSRGYEEIIVQDLRIEVEVTRYLREYWTTPDGKRVVAPLPPGIVGGFGPRLRQFIAAGHFQGQVTSERLVALLTGMGLQISKRQLLRLLTESVDHLIAEDGEVLRTGLETARWVSVDDTGARHARQNGYTTQMGDDRFTAFRTSATKSRINFLSLLQAGTQGYSINDAAIAKMRAMNMAAPQIRALMRHPDKHFSSRESWQAHLASLGFGALKITPDPIKVATEAALWGALQDQGRCTDMVILSDGAGQFRVGDAHALCWVHAERLVYKLLPKSMVGRDAVEKARAEIWKFYRRLRGYQRSPNARAAAALRQRFDRIFTQKSGYAALDRLLRRLYCHKDALLRVLTRPEIPLHTNASENDIRAFVTKRKISGGTVSDNGRRTRDAMLGLLKTCRKLGVNFYQFLADRFAVPGAQYVPPLPELVRAAAA